MGRQGARVPRRTTRTARCARRSRSFSRSPSSRRSRAPPASTVLFAADDRVGGRTRARRAPAPSRARARARRRDDGRVPLDRRLPALSTGRGRPAAGRSSTTRSRTARGPRGADRERPGAGAEPALRPGLERLGARVGLVPDPSSGAPGARLPRDGDVGRGGEREVRLVLLEALQMGAPPHGGFALGIERFVALLAGEPNLREIVAFPKVSSGVGSR